MIEKRGGGIFAIQLSPSEKHGNDLRAFLLAQQQCERLQAARQFLLIVLAVAGALLCGTNLWPGRFGQLKLIVVGFWLVLFVGLVVVVIREIAWYRRRERLVAGGREPSE